MAVAANRYTTAELLTDIRRKAHIPTSQNPFQDSDLLAIADGECQTAILRQVKTARENYYLTYVDSVVNTASIYDIPYRAIAGALQDVWIVNGTSIEPIGRSEINEQFSTVSSPTGYWTIVILGNQFKILPANVTGVVRQWYLQRPNTLVATTAAAQITGVNTGTGVLTFASLPTTFSSGIQYDCIADQPGFNWRFFDQASTGQTTTTVTFASLPLDSYGNSLIQVGDWLALAGQTPVPQIPVEFRPLLAQRTVVKYYEIQGYEKKMEAAEKKLKEMEKDLFELINPRVASEPKRIVPDSNVIGGYRRWRAWRAT